MKNLILLLLRNGGFIVFILLEFICLFLVVRYNRTQKEIFVNTSNFFSGNLNTRVANVTRYFNLTSTSDSLAIENARLYTRLSNINHDFFVQDSIFVSADSTQQYLFNPARVINNSINRNNNLITLRKLKSSSVVKPRQGVVSDKGVVGIVGSVSKNYALVYSILHRQIRINAAIKNSNNFGAVAWRGNDPTIVRLEDIPNHATFEKGDTVITSGYSPRFPKGITLGVIDTFWRESGSNFYNIDVKLTNDLNRIEYVYTIDNAFQEEQEALEQQINNE